MKPEKREIEPLLNARDVSIRLRCSLPLVYKMADRGQLPCIRWQCLSANGKRTKTMVRFREADIEEFLEANYVKC
ncbi:MAG: helix-turn-helix domain-containing protein [Desulfobacterales bacterium]|nr:MAG: helix-turn-helix domain-containing protein [Desulfobacterales bacterium]